MGRPVALVSANELRDMFDPFRWLGELVVYRLLGLAADSAVGGALHFFIMDVTKIFALLVAVIYVMGLLVALLSPERVRALGRQRPDWQARGLAVSSGGSDRTGRRADWQ